MKILNPMSTLPLDTSCQAEYEDGFILDETENDDQSVYIPLEIVDGALTGANTLVDILEGFPEILHGRMIRFSVFYKDHRYDVDWTELPDNARPIRFRDGNLRTDVSTGEQKFWWSGVRFGYQYTENGRNHKEVQELTEDS